MSATMLVLLRTLAESLNEDQLFVSGTATSGTSTTLVDTTEPGLYYTSGDANLFNRWFVYNELSGAIGRVNVGGLGGSTGTLTLTGGEFGAEGTANAAVSTDDTAKTLTDTRVSWVTNQWVGATVTCNTQTMVVTSNSATVLTGTGGWSSDPGDGASWALSGVCPYFLTPINPVVFKNAINRTLRNMYEPCFFPLSLHICASDENDMETDPATTFDLTKVTAVLANSSDDVFNGAQLLAVCAASPGGYTHMGNFNVNEGQSLYAAIMCRVVGNQSATFRVIDVTNGNVTIDDAPCGQSAWMELIIPFTVPSGCEVMHARTISDAGDDISYWDDYSIWRQGAGVYPCPSWLKTRGQMIDVRAFPHGTGGPASDNDYRINERYSDALNWNVEREDTRGNNPLHLWVQSTGGRRPYIYALRPLSGLSSDSATTTADKDSVVAVAEKLITDPKGASQYLGELRAAALVKPVATPPMGSWGVKIG